MSSAPRHDIVESIEFATGEAKIRIRKQNSKTYHNQTKYDLNALDNPDVWHMVVIHHEGNCNKNLILSSLFAIAGRADCYIVAYRQCIREDYFLIRLCRQFIAKLFYHSLKIQLLDGAFVNLTIKLNIGDYRLGQFHHLSSFESAFTKRCKNLELFEGVSNVLNLNDFAHSSEFAELTFTLSNQPSFDLLCSILTKHCDNLNIINGIRLMNNEISNLSSFCVIPQVNIELIDLRNNMISDITQLKYLEKINFTELFIANNPVTNTYNFRTRIHEFLPKVVKVDGVYTDTVLPSTINHLDSGTNTIQVIFQGDTIISDDSLLPHIFRKYKTSDMWHQVIINHNGKYAKTEILSAIFNMLRTHEFYPCHYETGDKCDSFFIRNCYEQMELIYNEKLKFRLPMKNDIITLTYKMNIANFKKDQIDPAERIQKAISLSFNLMDRSINLENFAARPELSHIEINLSVPRMMSNILLRSARLYLGNIEKLNLSNNNIDSSKGLHPLTWMKNLKSIDLSSNKIQNLSDIEHFPKIHSLNDISLKNNPCLANYKSPLEYIAAVKKIFPGILSLDGSNLSPDGCCVAQKNYLCSLDGYDLVEQFMQQYFTTYDSERSNLQGMYGEKAIMSISTNFSGLTSKTTDNRLKLYQDKSRNLLRLKLTSAVQTVFYGVNDITAHWISMPKTQHDFQSFSIDLTHWSPQIAVLKVCGLFKELQSTGESLETNQTDIILSFCRTFVLKRNADGAGFFGHSVLYSIINEQVLFHRPSVYQTKNSFRKLANMEIDAEDERLSSVEKESMIAIFQHLTCLVPLWCIRCLDQSSWNFKTAIELFTRLCKEKKVPDCAFNFHQ